MKKHRYLRNYYIKGGLQIRLTVKFLVLSLVLSGLSGGIVFLTIWPAVNGFVPNALQAQLRSQIILRLALYSLPCIGLLLALGLVITHRVAGPLYNVERTLVALLDGTSRKNIQIRDGDELQELVAQLNAIIARITQTTDQTP